MDEKNRFLPISYPRMRRIKSLDRLHGITTEAIAAFADTRPRARNAEETVADFDAPA